MSYPWHLYLMAVMYIIAGVFHFIKPKAYLRVMPRYLPNPKTLVFLSGLAEIILGIALVIPVMKVLAIYGILLMLLAFMPVHIYMLTEKNASLGMPKWILLLRIILQFGLMYWAWWYLKF
ncbi:MAG: DoxX family protein [Eudoraea sp.]|nr:DoxX family protein [Eudoraea sp.]